MDQPFEFKRLFPNLRWEIVMKMDDRELVNLCRSSNTMENFCKDDHYEALPLDYNHFKLMTKALCELANKCCDGRLISVLEGGYTPSVVANCAAVHINEMLLNS